MPELPSQPPLADAIPKLERKKTADMSPSRSKMELAMRHRREKDTERHLIAQIKVRSASCVNPRVRPLERGRAPH